MFKQIREEHTTVMTGRFVWCNRQHTITQEECWLVRVFPWPIGVGGFELGGGTGGFAVRPCQVVVSVGLVWSCVV